PGASRYVVPQYGQRPEPSWLRSMKTLGWWFHSGIFGLGQKTTPGPCRSRAVTSTTAPALAAGVAVEVLAVGMGVVDSGIALDLAVGGGLEDGGVRADGVRPP